MDFINFCCDLLAKSLSFLCFKYNVLNAFIVDNNFLVVIPLFCTNNLIKSSDSSAVKSKLYKLIKSILVLDYDKRLGKNDLELIEISYFLAVFLDGKIYIFLHYRFFSRSSDGKINYFKMLYNKTYI